MGFDKSTFLKVLPAKADDNFLTDSFPDNQESISGTGIVRIYRRIRCRIVQNGKFSESLEKQ